jgi:23S rRNA (uridine2552-2'-O)-methyltransferase
MAKERDIRDHWFREAKRTGHRSRAAFKLIELDERWGLLRPGQRVLDCGCAPGSWLQVLAPRILPGGRAVGIDLKTIRPLDLGSGGFDHVAVMHGDLFATPAEELLAAAGPDPRPFDLVLSDMAPSTTGDRTIDHHGSVRLCHAVLDRCRDVLRDGGDCVMKIFEGEAYPDVLERCRRAFDAVKGFKPKASRAISTEMYIVARGYRGSAADPATVAVEGLAPPRPKPAAGWGSGRT